MDDVAISVRNLSKRYQVFDSQRARLAHAFLPGRTAGMNEVWALRDVDFDVRRGQSVAIIGRNGGGKSTLLQILAGTLQQTSGEVRVNGRVCALLELGSGFNPEYTGRDNVVLNGLLLGLSREEVLRRFEEIASFADIGSAIERPVKTYSSGMVMRLAFAVQVLTDPDILIIDEALSVGDFFFQQKCFRYIRELSERGVTLLLVSHDMQSVRDLCTTGLFLKAGRMNYFGDNLEAIRRYLRKQDGEAADASESAATHLATPVDAIARIDRPLWSRSSAATAQPGCKGRLLAVGVFDASGAPAHATRIGREIVFRVLIRAFTDEPLHVSVVIKNKYDQVVTVIGSYTLRAPPPRLAPQQDAIFEATVNLMLEAGNYSFNVVLGQAGGVGEAGIVVDETPLLGPLEVHWDYAGEIPPFFGMVGLNATARFVPLEVAHGAPAGEA